MADKEILAVEIDDSAFSEFKRKFDEYQTAVKALPAQWQKSGTEITVHRTQFERASAELTKIGTTAFALERVEDAAGKIADATALAWTGIWKTGKLFQVILSTQHNR